MRSGQQAHTTPSPAPRMRSRLWLKPEAPVTGYVDGAWWPRSRDLTTELAALAKVLAVRLGSIERVAYALSTWDTATSKADVDGVRVRLEGFTYEDQNVIHMTGSNGDRISLLVVPPEKTGPADRPVEFLVPATLPAPREATEDSAGRWESDGGRLHRHD